MLDTRLHDIFDDKRTPGAPDTLYDYVREISMNTPTDGPAWYRRRWNGLGRGARSAALLAAVVAIVGVGITVTVIIPRTTGVGAGPAAEPSPMAVPSAPAGWRFAEAFGSPGADGLSVATNLLPPAPRIAIHVVCSGPDEVIVLVSTDADISPLGGQPLQAAEFSCPQDNRVELTATSGAFQSVSAVAVRNPSSLVDTNFTVSIEVPDATTTASPSP
jgi:hypothetical protein